MLLAYRDSFVFYEKEAITGIRACFYGQFLYGCGGTSIGRCEK